MRQEHNPLAVGARTAGFRCSVGALRFGSLRPVTDSQYLLINWFKWSEKTSRSALEQQVSSVLEQRLMKLRHRLVTGFKRPEAYC